MTHLGCALHLNFCSFPNRFCLLKMRAVVPPLQPQCSVLAAARPRLQSAWEAWKRALGAVVLL
jgi:hypothetical protein